MTQDPKAAPQTEESVPPKVRRALVILGGILILCAISASLLLWRQWQGGASPGSNFSQSLLKLEGGALTIEFPLSRTLPAGAGLSDWLDSVNGKERLKSVEVKAVAQYSVDARSDWDLTEVDGRARVLAPIPELKAIKVTREDLSFEIEGAPLAPEDEAIARDLLVEKLPSLLRQDEDERRENRLLETRAKIAGYVSKATRRPVDEIDVRFPGEDAAAEDASDEESP